MEGRRRELPATLVLDAALGGVAGGVLGARLGYVAINWTYFREHILEGLRLWEGGLAWHGGLLAGLLGVLAVCALRHRSPWMVLDALGMGAPLGITCGWLGCLLSACAYGVETYPGQGVLAALSLELPDLYGLWAPRVATQLLGAGWSVALFLLLWATRKRDARPGVRFLVWLGLYSAGAFALGFVRGDAMPRLGGWRVDQLTDLGERLLLAGGTADQPGRAYGPTGRDAGLPGGASAPA